MALLSRDEIFSADDFEYAVVECPEWGGDVRVRSMTAREKDAYETSLASARREDGSVDPAKLKDYRSRLVLMCAVDENGAQLFAPTDLNKLARKTSRPVGRIAEKIANLSKDDDEAVEEAAETFGDAQTDA